MTHQQLLQAIELDHQQKLEVLKAGVSFGMIEVEIQRARSLKSRLEYNLRQKYPLETDLLFDDTPPVKPNQP